MYGATTGALDGSITLTSLDTGEEFNAYVVNGAFRFPRFEDYPDGRESGDGRFLLSFDAGGGNITNKIINKDAAEYFVVINDSGDSGEGVESRGDTERSEVKRLSFFAGQNFPNPCDTSTCIKFSLPSISSVELCFYDLTGRKVLSRSARALGPGDHYFYVDTSILPPGVYLYRLTAGSNAAAKKMVIFR